MFIKWGRVVVVDGTVEGMWEMTEVGGGGGGDGDGSGAGNAGGGLDDKWEWKLRGG